jgi:uncharacterized protein YjbI with pentapeptide repeats
VGNKNNMTAQELLAAYAAGERNFGGADLRFAVLKGANLKGANLHEADRMGSASLTAKI